MIFILTEKQIHNIVGKIINEQTSNIVSGGTDARTVSHKYLHNNYGLPYDDKKYENYTYIAKIEDIIIKSKDKNISEYLSVFTPHEDKGKYLDYVRINDDELTQADINQRVNRVFLFETGVVEASHNGLLGIARAMNVLNGVGGTINLQFGQNKTGTSAYNERYSNAVNYNSETALNRGPLLSTIYTYLALATIKPQNREFTSLGKSMVNWDNNTLIERTKILINNLIMGVGGFIDPNNMDLNDIINNLKDKNYITNLNYDITPYINKLIKLQNIDDLQNNAYNTNKQELISKISDEFMNDFNSAMKAAYINNFKIFIINYLSDDQNRILATINQLKFPIENLGFKHKILFQSKSVTSSPSDKSNMTSTNIKYK